MTKNGSATLDRMTGAVAGLIHPFALIRDRLVIVIRNS
jgi:hypothetical protein